MWLMQSIMPKRSSGRTVPVQGRLTPSEVEKLDRIASEQMVPVGRSALVTYILRTWLESETSKRTKAAK
jgi:hypothetical protein